MDAKYRAIIAVLSEENRKLRAETTKLRSKRLERLKVCVTKDHRNVIYLHIYYGESALTYIGIFINSWHENNITFAHIGYMDNIDFSEPIKAIYRRLGFPENGYIVIEFRHAPHMPNSHKITACNDFDISLAFGEERIVLTPKAFAKICNAIMDLKGM